MYTYFAVEMKSLISPASSNCSNVWASPVDCKPITTHYTHTHTQSYKLSQTIAKVKTKFQLLYALHYLVISDGLLGEVDTVTHLGRDTEILKKALM